MASSTQQTQQVPYGAYLRVPGVGARPKRVLERAGLVDQTTNLSQGSSVSANTSTFSKLDIVRGYLLHARPDITLTAGTGQTITNSPAGPGALVQNLSVQFESAYKTFDLPGFLALAMQAYRPGFAPPLTPAMERGDWQDTVSVVNPNNPPLYFEIPVAQYFDLYWELNATGQPLGSPVPRAIVTPQYMSATTRNVIPSLTYNQLLAVNSQNNLKTFASTTDNTATGDTASTASGTVQWSFWRDGWYATKSQLTEPPLYRWQYTRNNINVQTAGAASIAIPLDDSIEGQGQIMSVIGCIYDPALNGGVGGIVPLTSYGQLSLVYGSNLYIYQDTPWENVLAWTSKHGSQLSGLGNPSASNVPTYNNLGNQSLFGWDLALTDDGKLTNEQCLNTLTTAGVQVRLDMDTVPSNGATVMLGIESLKMVGA